MKYFVNDCCIGCGLCVEACPGVFSMDDNGAAVAIDTDVPEEALDAADLLKYDCPVSAIEEVEVYVPRTERSLKR